MLDVSSLPFIRCEFPFSLRIQTGTLADEKRFGIEFAPEVVLADGSVQNLAWRICNAKKVLVSDIASIGIMMTLIFLMQAPYSMTPSRGRSTPAEMKA
jgi:phosphatidylethanolamine N-methyltransferase